jgi:hypothetical protein
MIDEFMTVRALWLIVGTIFYSINEDIGWAKGFYQSVNVGWSMGWKTSRMRPFDNVGSKFFSMFHGSMGVVFIGVVVMYIAKTLAEAEHSWSSKIKTELSTVEALNREVALEVSISRDSVLMSKHSCYQLVIAHLLHHRLTYAFIFWCAMGAFWACFAVDSWTWDIVCDFILSTTTGAGYISISDDSPVSSYIFVGIYAALGVPLCAVSIGMMLSKSLASPQDGDVLGKITAEVTPEEVEFLSQAGVDTNDGLLDHQAFLILTAIRLGAVTPELVEQIINRFNELDRKHEQRIAYADLVVGAVEKYKKPTQKLMEIVHNERFRNIVKEMKSTTTQVHPFESSSNDQGDNDCVDQRDNLDMLESQNAVAEADADARKASVGMIFGMKMLMKILRMRRKSSATNTATPSAPEEISSTLQQRISCSSFDEYDHFPDLKVNPSSNDQGDNDCVDQRAGLDMLESQNAVAEADADARKASVGMIFGISNTATPSAPAVALEDKAEISSTLQQRISCSSSDEYDKFPDLKVNPIRMIRIKLKFKAKCIESRQKKSAESSKDATGKGVPEIRYDSNDVVPLESFEETDEEHLTGGIGNISNKPTSRYDTSTGSTTRFRNAQPSNTARKPSADEQVPVIHSVPSLIMYLARVNKLRKTYKMEKQGGMRLGTVGRLPTTRVGWFVYSLRVLASDPYIRAFSAW